MKKVKLTLFGLIAALALVACDSSDDYFECEMIQTKDGTYYTPLIATYTIVGRYSANTKTEATPYYDGEYYGYYYYTQVEGNKEPYVFSAIWYDTGNNGEIKMTLTDTDKFVTYRKIYFSNKKRTIKYDKATYKHLFGSYKDDIQGKTLYRAVVTTPMNQLLGNFKALEPKVIESEATITYIEVNEEEITYIVNNE